MRAHACVEFTKVVSASLWDLRVFINCLVSYMGHPEVFLRFFYYSLWMILVYDSRAQAHSWTP